MAKAKLKWFREGYDPHEDLYLIPVGQERTEDGDLNTDAAVAWIKIAYQRTRFYGGRGGEGTSRPDSYAAYVKDPRPERKGHGIAIVEGADTVAHTGGLFSDKSQKAFTALRAAKQAISAALAKLDAVGPRPEVRDQGEQRDHATKRTKKTWHIFETARATGDRWVAGPYLTKSRAQELAARYMTDPTGPDSVRRSGIYIVKDQGP